MINLYIENIEKTFIKEANKKLVELLDFYFDPFDDMGEEYVFEEIFPQHLFRKNKDKCINTALELREYVNDLSIHNLTPLHEYALFNILLIIKDIEEDLNRQNQEIVYDEAKCIIETDKNGGFTLEDLNEIEFFLKACFEDYDFQEVEIIFDSFFKDPSIEEFLVINLEEYRDLVTEDIFQKYIKVKELYIMFKHLMKDKISLEKQNGEVFNNIQSSVQENKIYILDSSLKIEEGDRIKRILSNGLEEKYIVINSDFYEKNFSIPAHYELKVRKETSIEHTQLQTTTYIDNSTNTFNGNQNRINKHANDYSTNVSYNRSETSVFNQLRKTISESEVPQIEKNEIMSQIDLLEGSVGKPSFLEKYQNFITKAANHMTLISPFIPELTKLLPIG